MSKKIYQKRGLDRVTEATKYAKCGHASATRYYKCEACLPVLPSDDPYLYMGNEGDDEEIENEFGSEDDVLDLGCWE